MKHHFIWSHHVNSGCIASSVNSWFSFLLHRQVGRSCRAAEVIDMIQELLNLYLPLTYLRIDTGLGFIPNAVQKWCIGSDCLRHGLYSTGLAM